MPGWVSFERDCVGWASSRTGRVVATHWPAALLTLLVPGALAFILVTVRAFSDIMGDGALMQEVVIAIAGLLGLALFVILSFGFNIVLAPSRVAQERVAVFEAGNAALSQERDAATQKLREIERAPLSAEAKEHHDDLMGLLTFQSTAIDVPMDHPIYLWDFTRGDDLTAPFGHIRLQDGGAIQFTVDTEHSVSFGLLMQHLRDEPFPVLLEDWKGAVTTYLELRLQVLGMLTERWGNQGYVIFDDTDRVPTEEDGISPRAIFHSLWFLIEKERGSLKQNNFADERYQLKPDGLIWLDGQAIANGGAPVLNAVRNAMRAIHDEVSSTELIHQIESVAKLHVETQSLRLQQEIERIMLTHRLPRGSSCERCP